MRTIDDPSEYLNTRCSGVTYNLPVRSTAFFMAHENSESYQQSARLGRRRTVENLLSVGEAKRLRHLGALLLLLHVLLADLLLLLISLSIFLALLRRSRALDSTVERSVRRGALSERAVSEARVRGAHAGGRCHDLVSPSERRRRARAPLGVRHGSAVAFWHVCLSE